MLRKILSLLTIPGVIVHEFGHKLFCDLTNTRVRKVCYFRFGDPAGYVVHDIPNEFYKILLIVLGPMIFGTIFALICYVYSFFYQSTIYQYIFIWLGFSAAYNCFPSDKDGKILFDETNKNLKKNILSVINYPFCLFIWLQNRLNFLYIDLIYAVMLYLFVLNYFV
ncbi:MAG: metalloprotease family protein [Candidatus Aenigmatarchaeota archaeon]